MRVLLLLLTLAIVPAGLADSEAGGLPLIEKAEKAMGARAYDRAISFLDQAAPHNTWSGYLPYIEYLKGRIALSRGNAAEATRRYQTALRKSAEVDYQFVDPNRALPERELIAFLAKRLPAKPRREPFALMGTGYTYWVGAIAVGSDGGVFAGAAEIDSFVNGEYPGLLYDGKKVGNLIHVRPDGTLDETFARNAGNGFLGERFAEVHALAIQPDGKVLVGGTFERYGDKPAPCLTRILPDGRADDAFLAAVTGGAAAPFPQLTMERCEVRALRLAPDGKILVGGKLLGLGGRGAGTLARLNPDGTIDATFRPSGVPYVLSIAPGPDGVIYAGVGREPALLRLGPDGSRDDAFIERAKSTVRGRVRDVAPLPSGKLLVSATVLRDRALAGSTEDGVVRLNPDGTEDPSFRMALTTFSGVDVILPEPDGAALVGGEFKQIAGHAVKSIARLLPDGSVDPVFAKHVGAGLGTPWIGGVSAIARLPSGEIVAAGKFTRLDGRPATRNLIRLGREGQRISRFWE